MFFGSLIFSLSYTATSLPFQNVSLPAFRYQSAIKQMAQFDFAILRNVPSINFIISLTTVYDSFNFTISFSYYFTRPFHLSFFLILPYHFLIRLTLPFHNCLPLVYFSHNIVQSFLPIRSAISQFFTIHSNILSTLLVHVISVYFSMSFCHSTNLPTQVAILQSFSC